MKIAFSRREAIALAVAAGLVAGAQIAYAAETTLLNVSYDPTRELYQAYNEAFVKHWKEKTGEDVNGVPAVLVASTNDPWMSFRRALEWSEDWGAELVNLGPAGHINPQSGYGPWPRGLSILRELGRETLVPQRWGSGEPYHRLGEL